MNSENQLSSRENNRTTEEGKLRIELLTETGKKEAYRQLIPQVKSMIEGIDNHIGALPMSLPCSIRRSVIISGSVFTW